MTDLQTRRKQLSNEKLVRLIETAKKLKIRNYATQRKKALIESILEIEFANERSTERLEHVFDLIRKNPDAYFICEKTYAKNLAARLDELTAEIKLHTTVLDYLTK